MTREHQIFRRADATVREVVYDGETGTDIHIQAMNDTEPWECSCGAGPFDSKTEALEHRDSSSED